MKIAIVGGGAAGTACATRLRRLNENDEIVIFEKSGELALSNCGLPYLLSGIVEDGKALIGTTPEQMKQKYNIDCRLNAEVEFINRKDKSVTVKGREPESYDKLIIATGAYQLRPDINGILGEQIFTVNNLESIYKIKVLSIIKKEPKAINIIFLILLISELLKAKIEFFNRIIAADRIKL